MIFLVRGLAWFVILSAIATCSFTVKLGSRTTAQHIQRIWATEATQELVHEVKEKAGPAVEKIRRGVEAGVRGAAEPDAGPKVALPDAGPTPPDAGPVVKKHRKKHRR